MIHIAVTLDDNYTKPTAVMITSLLENNKDEAITFHIITGGLNSENKELLDNIVSDRYNKKIIFYKVDESIFDDFPMKESDHVSYATYYRLAFDKILPSTIDKILYLDGDIIVRDSILALWNTDISNYALGSTLDESYSCASKYDRLSIPPEYGYFCAGVLLINLKYWREFDLKTKAFNFIRDNYERILQHDQDVLNGLLFNKWLQLSYRWGYMHKHQSYMSEEDYLKDLNKESTNYPVIIHFTGGKPWRQGCYNLYRSEFDKYYEIAIGRTNPAKKRSFKLKFVQFMRTICGKSNWMDKYK